MKRAVIIVALIASFVAGVAAHSAIAIYRSPNAPEVPCNGIASVANSAQCCCPVRCGNYS